MLKPLITISPLGSVYVLGIPLTCSVEFALKELSVLNVQENQNCVYVDKVSINSELPKFNIIFSKSRESAWQGRINRIAIHASDLNINECEKTWEYFKSLFKRMNLTYSQKDVEKTCTLEYETRLCKIGVFKQFGINNKPNICPFGVYICSKYLNKNEYNADLINHLFHDKIEYAPMNETSNKIKLNKLKHFFIFAFSIIACILLYLMALNGRYMKIEDYCLFDKWTSKFIGLP